MSTGPGFTVIELMITVALVALISAMALPAYERFVASNQLASHTNALLSDLSQARSEAINRSREVLVCSGDGNCDTGNDWQEGWTVFIDTDGNEQFDDGGNDILITQREQLEGVDAGFTVTRRSGPGDDVLAFGPTGAAGDDTSGTLLQLCGAEGDRKASNGVFINGTGTARQLEDTDDDGIVEKPSGGDINTCP